jgi:hypothetical protein
MSDTDFTHRNIHEFAVEAETSSDCSQSVNVQNDEKYHGLTSQETVKARFLEDQARRSRLILEDLKLEKTMLQTILHSGSELAANESARFAVGKKASN